MEDFHKSPFGKMFMELLARHREKTSKQSSKPSGKYAGGEIAFLDLRKTNQDGNDGPKQDLSWEIIPLSLGEDLTLNFGEFPIDASESSLSDLGGQCASEILFKRKGLQRDFKKIGRKRNALRPSTETSLMEHDCVFSVDNHAQDKRVRLRRDGVVQTLAGRMGTGGGNVPMIVTKVHEKIYFSQSSYSDFSLDNSSSCLKASGGSYGGGE